MTKYRYFRSTDPNFYNSNHKGNELCVTIQTNVVKNDSDLVLVHWKFTLKHPKDTFNKQIAREVLNNQPEHVLILKPNFTRFEILSKIFAYLYYENSTFSDDYRWFVEEIFTQLDYGLG